MKISGDAGHNCRPDSGAIGYRVEDELTKEVWELIQQKLKGLGHQVTECTPYGQSFQSVSGSLGYRCKIANQSGSELHLCIHFNAGGGHGVEAYATSQKGREYAQRVIDEITKLGYTNRGVKDGSGLFVVKYTNMPCVLIECAFVDSQEDMQRYNADVIATAIVKAVTGQVYVQINKEVERMVNGMEIKGVQRVCNILQVRDYEGKVLVEDNANGQRTESARQKLKEILSYVMR
jgi:N-acetylmuramoyl-L-alanine amidase